MARRKSVAKVVPVKHIVPDTLATVSAQIIVAQHDADEFVLSFYNVRPPLLLGNEAERRAQAAKLDHIPAVCVARVCVAPARMPEIIEVLQQNLDNWRRRTGDAEDGEGQDHDSDNSS